MKYREFRELAEGDWELARKASGVRGKKTKRLVRRSSVVAEKLTGRFSMVVSPVDDGRIAKVGGCTIIALFFGQFLTVALSTSVIVPPGYGSTTLSLHDKQRQRPCLLRRGRVAANLVGANIRIVMVIVANKGGQLFHHISGYCQQRLVSGDRATTTIEGERFSQVRGLRLVATEEERLLAGVGVAIYHDRGAISRKCRGYDQSRQRWKIRLAL
ncbi:hypothetical protein GW17_00018827 [Ensete ventricosum]|nr:hypothetical protein GW17_00018827 [Ensete ventricosum]